MDKNVENIVGLEFGKINLPIPAQNITANYDKRVDYGINNLYPNFLYELYLNSTTHASIINSKTNYIFGDGLKFSDGTEIDYTINLTDTFDEFIDKLIFNYLLFNYVAIEVIYNSYGNPIHYNVLGSEQVRTNRSKNKFWFREDWLNLTKETVFDSFSLDNNSADTTSKIFWFDGFAAGALVYPFPDYKNGLNDIDTQRRISLFNANQISNQFSVATIVDFFVGENLSDEQKRNTQQAFEKAYTGESGKKFILSFNSKDGQKTEISSIGSGDWADAYINLNKSVQQSIMEAHSVTSTQLFGLSGDSGLFGANQLETSYEIFSNTYVRKKRRQLESALNLLFSNNEYFSKSVMFQNKSLFNTQIQDSTKEKIYTINELRKDAGLPSLGSKYDVLIAELEGSKNVAIPSSITSEQSENNVDSKVETEDVKKKSDWIKKHLDYSDFDKVKHLGSAKEDFEEIPNYKFKFDKVFKFDTSADVANYIISNDISNLTYSDLVDLLAQNNINVSTDELQNILKELQDANMININTNIDGSRINITPSQIATLPDSDSDIITMYDYRKRTGVSGSTIISTSRDFCKAVVESNKYYSREDIQNMSDVFGYDVFLHCGGFYYNPVTGETSASCRHEFHPVALKRKQNNTDNE